MLLINKYSISINDLIEEFPIKFGTTPHYVDLFINDKHKIFVEFKEPNINLNNNKAQPISYAKQKNIKKIILHNDLSTIGLITSDPQYMNWEEVDNPFDLLISSKKKYTIKPFNKNDLLVVLKEINNEIRTTESIDDYKAFEELNKIIFLKIFAETSFEKELYYGSLTREFYDKFEYKNNQGISGLFEKLKFKYYRENIFSPEEKINLKKETIDWILDKLSSHNFVKTKEDIKGIVYEYFISRELRGSLGQYFTPRIIIELVINFLNISVGSKICDPACGTGGFLINYFQSLKNKKLSNNQLLKEINDNIWGFDANPVMVKTAKMNMILHGDGHIKISKKNSLIELSDKFNEYDFILTNPPFGSKNVKNEWLTNFDLIKKNKKNRIIIFRNMLKIAKK